MEEPLGVVPAAEANGNEKGAVDTVVTFRKKSKKKAVRLRQKQQNDVGAAAAEKEQADTKQTRATREEEEEEEEEDLSQLLRETKRIHKDRTRIRGCEADATSEVVLSAIAEKGVMYPVTDGEGEGYMNSTFTVQKEAEGSQTIDPMLEKYIQEGLMEFRMKKARESLERTLQEKGMTLEKVIADKKQLQEERKKNEGEGQAKTEVMIEEEQIDMLMLKEAERRLYEIPEHLRVQEKPRSDDTISESWLTGIQEVELPMEFKLRNIEATEEAKKQILEGKTAPEPEDVGYNTRFQRPSPITQVVRANRKRGDSERKGQDQQHQHGDSNNANQPRPDRRNQATDDLAFERFKKRFRY